MGFILQKFNGFDIEVKWHTHVDHLWMPSVKKVVAHVFAVFGYLLGILDKTFGVLYIIPKVGKF